MAEEVKAPAAQANTEAAVAPKEEPKPEVKPEAKSDAAPAASDKKIETKEPSTEKPSEPVKYELKLPEGSALTADRLAAIESFAKENNLSNEQAQKLVDSENGTLAAFVENQKKQTQAEMDGWVDLVKNDKEMGGDSFKQNIELANRVVKRFGDQQFIETLEKTGLGNHPELVRTFMRIGKQMSEDQLVLPGKSSGGTRPLEDIFYGNKQS